MEPIFTLPYSEYAVIQELSKYFSKNKGYSINIPTSRQQKGFDFIIHNSHSRKSLTIQVKGSRTYGGNPNKKRGKYPELQFYTWFNTFNPKKGSADYYVLFGVYTNPLQKRKLNKSKKFSKWYRHILLIFNEKEMINFLNKLTTKKGDKQDSKFSFGFNSEEKIFLTRGALNQPEITSYLLDRKIKEVKKRLVKR